MPATGSRGGLFGAGGRFKGGTDPIMEKFNESIHFDKRYDKNVFYLAFKADEAVKFLCG